MHDLRETRGIRRWLALFGAMAFALAWLGSPSWTHESRVALPVSVQLVATAAADEGGVHPPTIESKAEAGESKPDAGKGARYVEGGVARLLERVIPDAVRNAEAERKDEAAAPAQ